MRIAVTEFSCEVCARLAVADKSTIGEPVINRGDVCVDLAGQSIEVSRMSPLRPELASLPKMRLCPDHLRAQRRQGGEWVTLTEAAAMMARRDRREIKKGQPQEAAGTAEEMNPTLAKLYESVLGTGQPANPYTTLRKKLGK